MTLTACARCHRCGVIAEGDPDTACKAADKHWADTGHPTVNVPEAHRG